MSPVRHMGGQLGRGACKRDRLAQSSELGPEAQVDGAHDGSAARAMAAPIDLGDGDDAGNALVGVVVGVGVWVLPLLALLVPAFRWVAAVVLLVYATGLVVLALGRLRRNASGSARHAVGTSLDNAG